MVVTIVNEEPDPSVVKEVICKECGVKLSYVPVDTKSYHGQDYTGGADGHTWIDCVKCQAKVILTSW